MMSAIGFMVVILVSGQFFLESIVTLWAFAGYGYRKKSDVAEVVFTLALSIVGFYCAFESAPFLINCGGMP